MYLSYRQLCEMHDIELAFGGWALRQKDWWYPLAPWMMDASDVVSW